MSFLQRSKSMLNEKIKEVLISTVDFREFEPVPIIIRLNVKEGMGKHEIITAIRSACKEFCDKKEIRGEEFTYKDFDEQVPNYICEKYGIAKLEIPFEQINLSYCTDLRFTDY